jgi:UDP-N-acetylmuramoylalanine--D-glutamate ligase
MLIGASGHRVAETLSKAVLNNFKLSEAKDMKTIVDQATSLAQPGDSIILSPGFPSFDMFKNFEDRGNQYRDLVSSL